MQTAGNLTRRLHALNVRGDAPTPVQLPTQPYLRLWDKLADQTFTPFPGDNRSGRADVASDWKFLALVLQNEETSWSSRAWSPAFQKLLSVYDTDALAINRTMGPLLPFLHGLHISQVASRKLAHRQPGYVLYHCDNCARPLIQGAPCSLQRVRADRHAAAGNPTLVLAFRWHVPLTPSELLEHSHLYLAGRRVELATGRLHLVDVSLPHCVVNLAHGARRTLVLDVDFAGMMTDWRSAQTVMHATFARLGTLGQSMLHAVDSLGALNPAYHAKRREALSLLSAHELQLCAERGHHEVTWDDLAHREEAERSELTALQHSKLTT